MAFSIGAGMGSGLGYRMGSSQIAVYAQETTSQLQSEGSTQSAADITEGEVSQDEQARTRLLEERLANLELRLASLELKESDDSQEKPYDSDYDPRVGSEQKQDQLSGQLQSQLERAGFTDGEYDVISATRNQLRLKRLQLRDTAIREGWFRTDSWSRQVRELEPDTELRKTLGDQRFDDYLIATGRNNRVRIDELMAGSAAEQAGLLAGDVIHRYADMRVFSSGELRSLTTGGQVGDNTALTVRRDGELIDLTVPRGPLGVVISGATVQNNVNR